MIENKKIITTDEELALAGRAKIKEAKRAAEIVTLREWFDSTPNKSPDIQEYIDNFSNLGRLGKELHSRGVRRVTERLGNDIKTLVEATYVRSDLDLLAPLCALALIANKRKN